MIRRNPYDILGVPRDANAETIRGAYRKLAKRWHPDRNPGNAQAEDGFKEVAAAYEILSNAERRAQFDRENPPPASDAHWGERRQYSFDVGYSAKGEARAEFEDRLEETREEQRARGIKPNLWLIALAVWIGFAFAIGMVRGYSTALDGVVVSVAARSILPREADELLYTSPLDVIFDLTIHPDPDRGDYDRAQYLNKSYLIRSADGHIETFKPGPACSFLSAGAAIGSRVHKESGRWTYELDGRVVSDLPYVQPPGLGLRGLNCFAKGWTYPVVFVFLLAVGLLWRAQSRRTASSSGAYKFHED